MLTMPGTRSADDAAAVVPEGTAAPQRVPAAIFAAAAQAYASGARLDMQSLARDLGVARATLYRRAGNREELLDEVLWWRARRLLADQVTGTTELAGVARITAVIAGVLAAIEQDRPLRTLLETDPETALRILTGTRSTVQRGMATALESLIELERGRGAFTADLDTPTLAYAILRICEAFLYADLIADRRRDIGRAVTVIKALLVGLDRTPGTMTT
ncbi:MAG TPA: QsdR family transcriptional regulator [Streptosporangiaceae bacterium]|nr:QsdR family transcriptional regulator [Streptosporangiaceae bacterium]